MVTLWQPMIWQWLYVVFLDYFAMVPTIGIAMVVQCIVLDNFDNQWYGNGSTCRFIEAPLPFLFSLVLQTPPTASKGESLVKSLHTSRAPGMWWMQWILGGLLDGGPHHRSQLCCGATLLKKQYSLFSKNHQSTSDSWISSTEIYLFPVGRSTNTSLWPTKNRTASFCLS